VRRMRGAIYAPVTASVKRERSGPESVHTPPPMARHNTPELLDIKRKVGFVPVSEQTYSGQV